MAEVAYYGDIEKVKKLSNKGYEDFGLDDEDDFETLIEDILTKMTSHINTRLIQGEIDSDDISYEAICDIAERKVLDMFSIIHQIQDGDIVSIDELSTHIINTTDAIVDLDRELESFHRGKIQISWTGMDEEGEEE